ncbi:MAG: serine/threonine protein kinase [Acidobacteria bacterium]|nr:serine/threonine protein kinase [Acidobacteriota bacterium]MCB9398122.1 serine/threonine protein kinase [Acidobacteriota bacterium]
MSFPQPDYVFQDTEEYRFRSILGRGGNGSVFRISNKAGRYYACKVFSPDIMTDPELYRNFKMESQIGINIYHEHLVSFHKRILLQATTGLAAGKLVPAIIMDYIDGIDLAKFKKVFETQNRKPFPRQYASLILAKVCSGVEALHHLKIQHGDLKPENILISQTGFPKVTDYGIASLLGDRSSREELGGTIRYLAPEQIRKAAEGGAQVDHRADIYSIGVMALELTANLPEALFGHPGRILHYIVNCNADFKKYVEATDLPSDLKFVIRSCLDEKLDRRPANLRELQSVFLQTLYGKSKGITLENIGDEMHRLLH